MFILFVIVCYALLLVQVFLLIFPFYHVQPNTQTRSQKEGSETDQFWSLLGGKSEYSGQKMVQELESDPHLFSCILSKGNQECKLSSFIGKVIHLTVQIHTDLILLFSLLLFLTCWGP